MSENKIMQTRKSKKELASLTKKEEEEKDVNALLYDIMHYPHIDPPPEKVRLRWERILINNIRKAKPKKDTLFNLALKL